MLVVVLAAIVQTLALVSLVACAVLSRRRRLPPRLIPALILLLFLSDAPLIAALVTHAKAIPGTSVPERP